MRIGSRAVELVGSRRLLGKRWATRRVVHAKGRVYASGTGVYAFRQQERFRMIVRGYRQPAVNFSGAADDGLAPKTRLESGGCLQETCE